MIKAIITDFDGTLVDTFESNLRAYQQAFYACAFSSLTIPQSVTYIDESAIDKCSSLSSIVWESPCQPTCIHLSRKNKSFNIRDSIVSFVLGNSMTTIPDSLFRGMKNLTTVMNMSMTKFCLPR